jgi:hypothetical protein
MSSGGAGCAEHDEAGALARRLGVLAEQMLIAADRHDGEALHSLLRQQEEVRERLEPLTARLGAEYDRLLAGGDPRADRQAAVLQRVREQLERAFHANRTLEEQVGRTCAALETQLALHRRRSGAVLSYGVNHETSGSAFTRVG